MQAADAVAIWKAGVAAVDARKLVRDSVAVSDGALRMGDCVFRIAEIERIVLVGFGKASGAMAVGFEQALGDNLNRLLPVVGLINVPDDQVVETESVPVVGCRPPGENLPTTGVVQATERIIELVRSAGKNDICVCLISGGGSALLEKPEPPITLKQFRSTTSFLSNAGATIYELNAVRRIISQVKGGGLAQASGGAPIISLILSDVIGDCLDVIASGPTVDSISPLRAVDVLNKFDPLRNQLPAEIWSVVETKTKRIRKPDQELDVTNIIIGNIETALDAAREKASELGYAVEAVTISGDEGDAGEVGKEIAGQILHLANRAGKICCLAGGESTVRLCDNPGRGGRNQHLVLSLISAILPTAADLSGEFCLLSGGTDGEDGNVSVAGAVVDSGSIRHLSRSAQPVEFEAYESLNRCDSHSFLSKYDLVFRVPRTFTNVCDLRVLLVANGGESASSTVKMP